MSIFLGIDPGLDGGLVWFRDDGKILRAHPMPIGWAVVNGTRKRYVDPVGLTKLINENNFDTAVIENVHASPQMGVTSAFNFGKGFGTVLGVLAASGCSPVHVAPSVWKPALGCTSDKRQTVTRAIWPEAGALITAGKYGRHNVKKLLKKTEREPPYEVRHFREGCVEAALIALWAFRC
jgi:crossover junction endodeoxyribonuclease RuvC